MISSTRQYTRTKVLSKVGFYRPCRDFAQDYSAAARRVMFTGRIQLYLTCIVPVLLFLVVLYYTSGGPDLFETCHSILKAVYIPVLNQ